MKRASVFFIFMLFIFLNEACRPKKSKILSADNTPNSRNMISTCNTYDFLQTSSLKNVSTLTPFEQLGETCSGKKTYFGKVIQHSLYDEALSLLSQRLLKPQIGCAVELSYNRLLPNDSEENRFQIVTLANLLSDLYQTVMVQMLEQRVLLIELKKALSQTHLNREMEGFVQEARNKLWEMRKNLALSRKSSRIHHPRSLSERILNFFSGNSPSDLEPLTREEAPDFFSTLDPVQDCSVEFCPDAAPLDATFEEKYLENIYNYPYLQYIPSKTPNLNNPAEKEKFKKDLIVALSSLEKNVVKILSSRPLEVIKSLTFIADGLLLKNLLATYPEKIRGNYCFVTDRILSNYKTTQKTLQVLHYAELALFFGGAWLGGSVKAIVSTSGLLLQVFNDSQYVVKFYNDAAKYQFFNSYCVAEIKNNTFCQQQLKEQKNLNVFLVPGRFSVTKASEKVVEMLDHHKFENFVKAIESATGLAYDKLVH